MYTSPFKSVTIFTHFIYNLIYFIHIKYVINFKKLPLTYIIIFDTVINFMQSIMRSKQTGIANAQIDTEKYRIQEEEILDV